jgi:uncharacterized zinc-type alcohol dehydrogenase-like protein
MSANTSTTEALISQSRTALGYATRGATESLAPFTFERRTLRPGDVRIEILYCGVCHSDLHQARNEWKNSLYPMVPGHEIVGRVTAVGETVTGFRAGDLAAVGCLVDSCRVCASCAEGLEQYCESGLTPTYNGKDKNGELTFGGYSSFIVVTEEFVLRVPDQLDLKAAAPLLCAGITLYSPLRHWKAGPGMNVGIIGLGGLGHMGVKFAHAMGATVTMITTSSGKERDARRLGADGVLISKDAAAMKKAAGSFDLLVNTIPVNHDLNPYVALLKRDATMVIVGAIEPITHALATAQIVMARRSIAGSLIGGIAETQEMLDYCAKHDIVSDVEMIDIQAINEAYARMLKSDVKYRFVIDMASLKRSNI